MPWNQLLFEEAVRNKMAVQRQNAESDAMRANSAVQDVNQRPEIQARSDAAAMQRAELAAETQKSVADLNEAGANARSAAASQTQRDIANIQDTGATTRTGMQTGTQMDIAGMEDRTRREKIAQDASQFDRSLALDTAKAQDTSSRDWAVLSRPEFTKPEYNLKTGQMESGVKRPAISRSGPSAMDTLTGRTPDSFSSPSTQQESPAGSPSKTLPATTTSPAASALASVPDTQLLALKGQADRGQVMTPPSSPAPVASSNPDNSRNGLFSNTGANATPTALATSPTPAAAPTVPTANPRAALNTDGPSTFQRISAALTPAPNSPGMAALRDVGSGISSLGNALGFNRNWSQGLRSLAGGETPDQLRARRAAAAAAGQ